MIDKETLKILVCPKDHSPLSLADHRLTDRLNRAIAAGRIVNQAGRKVTEPVSAALVREDRTVLYPIVDDIPLLLADEAIPLEQIALPK